MELYPQYIVEIDGKPVDFPHKNDLVVIMNFVDKLRLDYPHRNIAIYEISKNVIDY